VENRPPHLPADCQPTSLFATLSRGIASSLNWSLEKMSKSRYAHFLLVILLLALAAIACSLGGGDSPTPSPTSEAVTPEVTPETGATTAAPTPETVVTMPPLSFDWAPEVVFSSPQPGEEALLNGAITIRFDQPMDEASVESAFKVQPAGSEESVGGTFDWPRPDTVIFTPESSLQREQVYDVEIGEAATARNGKSLRTSVSFRLQTVGFLDVSQTIPPAGTEEVETDAAITVLFNRPVVPLVATTQQDSLPQPLQIEPAVTGSGEWVSTSIYRFVPDEPLAGATRYTITIAEGLADVTGGVLGKDVIWSFTTASPNVAAIEPADTTASVNPTFPLTVTFNMPMDPASTEAAIRLEPSVSLAFEWSEDGRVVTLRPAEMLALGTTYQLVVGQSAQSANGAATLDRETASTFTTVSLPAVINTQPVNGAQAEYWQSGFSVQFASPMNLDTLDGRIRIEPAPEDEPQYFFDDFNYFLHVSFDLARNTNYVVTIPGDAADPYGNTLGQDYTFSFRTAGFQPVTSLNLPIQISQLSTSYPSNVQVVNRNVSQFNAALYNVDLPVALLIEPYDLVNYIPPSQPLRTWNQATTVGQDEAEVVTLQLADGGTLAPGVYFLDLSAPEVAAESGYWQNQNNLVIVADTNLVVKEMFGEVHVWATDLATGQPAPGRNLTLYIRGGTQVGTAVTDNNGFATFAYDQPQNYLDGVMVISNAPGQSGFGVASSTWSTNDIPWDFGLPIDFSDEQEPFIYIYTDRPIYRPGDTVYFKGIVRDPNYGRYNLPAVDSLEVTIEYTNFFDSTPPETFRVTAEIDETGAFTGEYPIGEEARLGNYRIYVSQDNLYVERAFTVAEYRAPEFLVTITPDQEEALRGESVEVVVEASYLFGGPATDLLVQWNVLAEPHTLPWEGPYYSFTDSGGFFFEDQGPFAFPGGQFGEFLDGGEGRTDADGRFVITLPADLLDALDPGSRTVTVEANVYDINNFPVASRTSVDFHAAELYAGITPDDYLGTAGSDSQVNVITVDWDGRPVANTPVEVVFYQREWQAIRDEQFNTYFTRFEAIDTEVERVEVTTDAQGRAQASFTPEAGGNYLAVATVTDEGGRTNTSSTGLWVLDEGFIGWRTDPKSKTMDLTADKQEYEVGDTAHLLVQSPFNEPVLAWLTIERGTMIEQTVVALEGGSPTLDIPITADFAPNVFVSVIAIRPANPAADGANRYAAVRMGIIELKVSPAQLALNVALTPQQEQYEPGDTAVYDIAVTDYAGNPVQADLSLALVDLAVLSLKPDNAPSIVDAFYARQPYRSQIGGGLFISGEGLEVEVPLEQGGLGGGGGGEADGVTSVRLAAQEDDVRRNFRDTAYWEAHITTDGDGRASVAIPLPDNLTTWRLSSKAVTADTLVGQSSVDIITSLPLLVRPVTPRFFTVGDSLQLGAIVHNNTDQSIDATVTLDATGVTLSGPAEQTVSIAAGGSQLVQWPVVVDDVTFADLTFRAEGGGFSDASKPTLGLPPDQLIPVTRYAGEDIVGTAGVLDEAGQQVEAILLPAGVDTRQGEVQIELSPSLAASIIETLDYINNNTFYDPACAHGIIDQLLPNLATARAIEELDLTVPMLEGPLGTLVEVDLEQLEAAQKGDGGWGWCYNVESDPFLSAYVLFGLDTARDSGYPVNTQMLSRATTYVRNQLEEAADLGTAWEANRQAFFLFVLAEVEAADTAELDALYNEHRPLLDPYAKALLALAYQLAGGDSGNQETLLTDLNNSVIVSATGAHWEDATPDWDNLNSDVRGTAMVLAALSQLQPENPLAANAVRWLMSARTAQRWPTGQDTAWTILALTDWMAATGELEADYDYQVGLNTVPLSDGSFSQENIASTEQLSVPMRDMVPEEVNFLTFTRGEGDGRLYYSAHMDSFISADQLPAVNRGIIVQRAYYPADCDRETEDCQPITTIQAGEAVRVELTIIVPNDLLYAIVEDHFPAGAEAIDPNLETSVSGAGAQIEPEGNDYRFGYWGWWYFDRIEYRDDRIVFRSGFLPAGTYQYSYTLQTTLPGQYQVIPTIAYQEFIPEVFGRSEGMIFTVEE
jgi:uncharacterized protein YfaS (alpha-2-macroglobulin family)